MLRSGMMLAGMATVACCGALPAGAAAHGPPKITAGPTGTTTDTTARFEFTYDEPAPTQTFECSLDGAAFTACEDASLPGGFQTYSALAAGPHTFKVRRVSLIPSDPLGDTTPAERAWTVAGPEPTPTPTATPSATATPTPTATATPGPAAKPAPCHGVLQITDPADYHHDNEDVIGGFFRYADGKLTANIVLTDLSTEVGHQDNTGVFWRLRFNTADGQTRYVGAAADRSGKVTYEHGTVTGTTGYARAGDSEGRFFAGRDGVVEIAVADVAPGSTLSVPVAVTGETVLLGGEHGWADRAPGQGSPDDPAQTSTGADYVVRDCDAPAAAPGPGPGGPGAPSTGVLAVKLERTEMAAQFGRRVTVRGSIEPAQAGVRTELVDAAGRVLAVQSTADGGHFAFRLRVRRALALKVRAAGVSSQTLPVRVIPAVRLKRKRSKRGLRLHGTIRPAPRFVDIEQRSRGQWVTVATVRVRNSRFSVLLRGVRRGTFRVRSLTA